jgi:hypothetical protein
MDNLRIVEVQRDGWQQLRLMDLMPGDVFRMFESEGEPVVGNDGETEWVVRNAPYMENGRATVDVNLPNG